MKKGTTVESGYDSEGRWHLKLRKAKGKFTLDEIIEHSDTDEVFWEHIDRVVIDKLKLEFGKRDYTDNGKVVNFEGDEEND